jgi:hypothetical protein
MDDDMTIKRDSRGHFLKGSGGRKPGSRNRLSSEFIEALHADFSEHGSGVISIVRLERPDIYIRVIASLLPRELRLEGTSLSDQLQSMTDDELADAIEQVRRSIAADQAEPLAIDKPRLDSDVNGNSERKSSD